VAFSELMNTIGVILINILMHPSFIMAVNGTNEYEAEESASKLNTEGGLAEARYFTL